MGCLASTIGDVASWKLRVEVGGLSPSLFPQLPFVGSCSGPASEGAVECSRIRVAQEEAHLLGCQSVREVRFCLRGADLLDDLLEGEPGRREISLKCPCAGTNPLGDLV